MNLDASQRAAVLAAASPGERLRIVTGPAGTGKTTVIRSIAETWMRRCRLLAPTGKAAARVREACGLPAATVHRELLYDGAEFRRCSPFDAPVIVDEASMLDSALLAKLLSYNPPKLVLVGDVGQLPPVGSGQPFHDLVAAGRGVSELTVNHRAREAVHEAATAIRAGRIPAGRVVTPNESWEMLDTGGAEATTERLLEFVRAGGYDPRLDVVLSPRYGEEEANDAGIDALNRSIRAVVNPPVSEKASFEIGDRVLCCKNFGTDDLWNGDTGSVAELSNDDLPIVRLDRDPEDPRTLTPEQVRECRLGYAMSVHKAQGSQFRRVFFVVMSAHRHMLSRALIYTAVTRARAGCVVLGQLRAFEEGIRTVGHKRTALQRLMGGAARAVDMGEIGL